MSAGKVTTNSNGVVDNSRARREGRPASDPAGIPDPEVVAKPTRRRSGALLRREGLYSTHLSAWRRERERGALEMLRARRRGRKADPTQDLRQQIAALEGENQRLQERLRQAEAIITAQKKLSEILGLAGAPAARERA